MSALPNYLVPILEKIANSEGLIDFTTDVDSGSNIGDNFTSELLRIVIKGFQQQVDGNKVETKLHLLCKLAPESAKRRKDFQVVRSFDRESYFYTKLVPQFMQFQREKSLSTNDQFKSFPKCYEVFSDAATGVYVIIIEDLRPKKFGMWPKEKPLPSDHLKVVLRELAKYHAISFALKDQRPEQFAEHKKLDDITEACMSSENMRSMFRQSYQRVIDVLQDDEQKDIMRDVQQNFKEYFQTCQSEVAANRFGVVTHGDFWNNNILFRTNETAMKVEEVCLVDWQCIRYVSPAIDLLNLIFTSTDKNTRKNHLKDLLRTYHNQLTNNIRKLGSQPEKLFPYKAFVTELKKCGNFALSIAPLMIQICVADPNDVNDLDEICEESTDGNKKFDLVQGLSKHSQSLFNERVCDCIEDLVKFGYYRKSTNEC